MSEYLTVQEAADRLGKTPPTIREWVRRGWLVGKVPPSGVGMVIAADSIDAAMQPVVPEAAGNE